MRAPAVSPRLVLPVAEKRSVSLSDVARYAGVSAQTVSRVVNGSDAVRPAMRERVVRAMDDLGYRPNSAARMLKLGRFGSIGLAMFRLSGVGNLATIEGLTEAAAEHRYAVTLIEVPKSYGTDLESAARLMARLPVDAAVITVNYRPADFDTFQPHPGLRTVVIASVQQPNCTTVGMDQAAAARLAVEHLLGLGHRTVHFISGPERSIPNERRLIGWRDALASHGITAPEVTHGLGDWSADSGYDAGLRLADDPGCTAIFAASDAIAYGAIQALRDRGRRVPEDVSVIGVDNAYDGIVPRNELTSVALDNRKKGRVAFDEALGKPSDEGVHITLIPPHLVVRHTTAPAPSR